MYVASSLQRARDEAPDALGWLHRGLVVLVLLAFVLCGLMLGTSEADKYYPNAFFWTKMTLLSLTLVHAIVFRSSVYRNTEALDSAPTIPMVAKVAAVSSMILWAGIATMGRLIAYYE